MPWQRALPPIAAVPHTVTQQFLVRREPACKWGSWTLPMLAWSQQQAATQSRRQCSQHKASWLWARTKRRLAWLSRAS